MRSDLFSMLRVQEALLQQYRSLSVALLALLSAVAGAALHAIVSHWAEATRLTKPITGSELLSATYLLLWIGLVAGTAVGFLAINAFRAMYDVRENSVTHIQNLLIADYAGKIDAFWNDAVEGSGTSANRSSWTSDEWRTPDLMSAMRHSDQAPYAKFLADARDFAQTRNNPGKVMAEPAGPDRFARRRVSRLLLLLFRSLFSFYALCAAIILISFFSG